MGIEAISAQILSSSASRVKNAPLLFCMSDVNTKAIGDSGEQFKISLEGLVVRGGGASWSLLVIAMLVRVKKTLENGFTRLC